MSNNIVSSFVAAVKAVVVIAIVAGYKVRMIVSKFSRDSYPEIRKYCTGNVLTWFASRSINTVTAKKITGTVKEHKDYDGEKQTILTRCKVM